MSLRTSAVIVVAIAGGLFAVPAAAQSDPGLPKGTARIGASSSSFLDKFESRADSAMKDRSDATKSARTGQAIDTPLLFRFQLVAPSATAAPDKRLMGIDDALRSVLKYPGYRQVASAILNLDWAAPSKTRPMNQGSLVMVNGDEAYNLTVQVDSVLADGVRIGVTLSLRDPVTPLSRMPLLSTTLTLSLGKTVVLGTTQRPVPGRSAEENVLILVVQPEIRK